MRKTICWNDMTLTFECFFNSIPQLMKLEQNENHNSPTRQLFRDFSGLGMTIEELAYFLDAAQLYCPLELIRQPGNIILHIIYCSPCKPLRCISCWISLKNVAADDYSEFAQALVTVKIFSHLLIACDSLFMNLFFFVKRNVHIIIYKSDTAQNICVYFYHFRTPKNNNTTKVCCHWREWLFNIDMRSSGISLSSLQLVLLQQISTC